MTNPMGKTRPVENPYLIYENMTGWRWRVLKAYTADPNKQYARWLCDVSSPYTFGGSDMGDTYIADIVSGNGLTRGRLTHRDPIVPDSLIPDPAKVVKGIDW